MQKRRIEGGIMARNGGHQGSGMRADVFLKIKCTIQISGSVWQIKNGCLFLLVKVSEFYRELNNLRTADL